MKSKVYLLTAENRKETVSAFSRNQELPSHELMDKIQTDMKELPFEFDIVRLIENNKGLHKISDLTGVEIKWPDVLPNDLTWFLISKEFKDFLDEKLSGDEGVTWILAKINAQGECRDYFIPFFENELDILDMGSTKYVPGTDIIINAAFDLKKIEKFAIFHGPTKFWKIPSAIYLGYEMKEMIDQESFKGLKFE